MILANGKFGLVSCNAKIPFYHILKIPIFEIPFISMFPVKN